MLVLAAIIWAVPHVPAIPYNIRELVAQQSPIVSAFFLAIAVAWVFGFPGWAAVHMICREQTPAFLPVYMLLHAIVAWVLLRWTVPLESIHDVVGAPVLGWPWEWELIGRFTGLFALWTVISFGAAP